MSSVEPRTELGSAAPTQRSQFRPHHGQKSSDSNNNIWEACQAEELQSALLILKISQVKHKGFNESSKWSPWHSLLT